MVVVESPLRQSETLGEVVQLLEAGVAHQMAPASLTKPPVRSVDEQSQRRRSGRTRTGIGFGRAPSTRTPAPIPTAVATMVTIQEATMSTYSPARDMSGRAGNHGPDPMVESDSVCATATRAASATRAWCRGRRSRSTTSHRSEHRQKSHGIRVSVRAGSRIVGRRHRSTFVERDVAGLAAELVHGHEPECRSG